MLFGALTKKNGMIAAAVAAVGVVAGWAQQASAVTVYAIDTRAEQRLLTFDSESPDTLTSAHAISGLQTNEQLVGIDFRPSNGLLYGVGSSGRVYTLDLGSAAATNVSTIGTQLNGTRFGIDFNPVVDRLRIVSDLEQNLRVNVDTGAALVDSSLAYVAGDTGGGGNPNIVAAGYTNNFAGATSTTLYEIDSIRNTLVIQNPPNAGTLTTVAGLGTNPTSFSTLDIATGTDGTNTAYAAFQVFGEAYSRFFTVNLTNGVSIPTGTGPLQERGIIGTNEDGTLIRSIAVVPEPGSISLLALGGLSLLARRRRA